MDTHVWLAYVVTAIVFSLAPGGSGTVNSISNGLSYGTRKSLGGCDRSPNWFGHSHCVSWGRELVRWSHSRQRHFLSLNGLVRLI